MRETISDIELDRYYARDYYGVGTDYFNPPEWDTEDDLYEVLEDYEDDDR